MTTKKSTLGDFLQVGVNRYRAFLDSGAWILLILGVVLFSLRTPFASGGFVNLPELATVLQGLGLVFSFAGLSIMVSILMFPQVSVGELWRGVTERESVASAIALVGVLLFNGVLILGCVTWAAQALSLSVMGR